MLFRKIDSDVTKRTCSREADGKSHVNSEEVKE